MRIKNPMYKVLSLLSRVPLLLMCVPEPAPAQTDSQLKAIAFLTGIVTEESLVEQEVEGYLRLMARPLELNRVSRARLLSCGLFSPFQVASILDYRSRCGDVLSFSELSALDGFQEDFVAALKPFVSLGSDLVPGRPVPDSLRIRQDVLLRGAIKGSSVGYGLKYKIGGNDRMEASFAARNSDVRAAKIRPSSWSGNVSLFGRRVPGTLIAGDYNARFGQGLALWSGFSLSGFQSSYSFCRHPTGLSPSWSYSGMGTHRGVAADLRLGNFVVTAMGAFPGLRKWCEGGKPSDISFQGAANLLWYGRNGQASVTLVGREILSADFRVTADGTDYFGEAAWSFSGKAPAVVAGAIFPVAEELRFSTVMRCYAADYKSEYGGGARTWSKTSNEYGTAAGVYWKNASFTVDVARKANAPKSFQSKFFLDFPLKLSRTWTFGVRLTERVRPHDRMRYKTGVRVDLGYVREGWSGRLRAEAVHCRSLGLLSYVEIGKAAGPFSAYLRGTVYRIRYGDDRIHVYERDAPGNFNVPGYYGNGFRPSFVASCRLASGPGFRSLHVYLRAATGEVKLQAVFRI